MKRGEFSYCWPACFMPLAACSSSSSVELILRTGSEVAHIEEPTDFDYHFVILFGDTRGPFDRLFARLHINYVVAADHFLHFGKRAVGNFRLFRFCG